MEAISRENNHDSVGNRGQDTPQQLVFEQWFVFNDVHLRGSEPVLRRGLGGNRHSALSYLYKGAPFKSVQCKIINLPSWSVKRGVEHLKNERVNCANWKSRWVGNSWGLMICGNRFLMDGVPSRYLRKVWLYLSGPLLLSKLDKRPHQEIGEIPI